MTTIAKTLALLLLSAPAFADEKSGDNPAPEDASSVIDLAAEADDTIAANSQMVVSLFDGFAAVQDANELDSLSQSIADASAALNQYGYELAGLLKTSRGSSEQQAFDKIELAQVLNGGFDHCLSSLNKGADRLRAQPVVKTKHADAWNVFSIDIFNEPHDDGHAETWSAWIDHCERLVDEMVTVKTSK